MIIDLNKPLRQQAEIAVANRDANHHIDEKKEPRARTFLPAVLDQFAVGTAINYKNRYKDEAYFAIRGREQQMIDAYGGARSDTAPGPQRTENSIRGVGKGHKRGRDFHSASDAYFGNIHHYTGH